MSVIITFWRSGFNQILFTQIMMFELVNVNFFKEFLNFFQHRTRKEFIWKYIESSDWISANVFFFVWEMYLCKQNLLCTKKKWCQQNIYVIAMSQEAFWQFAKTKKKFYKMFAMMFSYDTNSAHIFFFVQWKRAPTNQIHTVIHSECSHNCEYMNMCVFN